MYKLVAAILLGNGVGGRMATAPHHTIHFGTQITICKNKWAYISTLNLGNVRLEVVQWIEINTEGGFLVR